MVGLFFGYPKIPSESGELNGGGENFRLISGISNFAS